MREEERGQETSFSLVAQIQVVLWCTIQKRVVLLSGCCQRWVMRRRKAGNEASVRGGGWEMDKEDSTSSDSQAEDLDRSDVDVELLQAVEAEAFARQIRCHFCRPASLPPPIPLHPSHIAPSKPRINPCTSMRSPCQNSSALAPCPFHTGAPYLGCFPRFPMQIEK